MEAEQLLDWKHLRKKLTTFVHHKVKDRTLTEDIVHDVLLKVQSHRHQLKNDEKLVAWIFQIARNTMTDHYRKTSKIIQHDDLHWESDEPNFNDCVAKVIDSLIPTLPPIYRVPLELTVVKGISQLEVAGILNMNYSTTKARVQRARKLVRDKLNAMLVLKTDGFGNVIKCERRRACC